MKTALDTNILVRLLVNDDPSLVKEAADIVRNNTCVIFSPILAEVIFVLTSYYEYNRKEILNLIEFLDISNFEVEDFEVNIEAIKIYSTTNLAYMDAWLIAKSKSLKLPITTFDKQLQKYTNK